MEIVYLNQKDPRQNELSQILIGSKCYELVRVVFACAQNTDNPYKNFDTFYRKSVQVIQKQIQAVIDHPDLDDAIKLYVSYEGRNFYESIHHKEGVVYGRYGFKAEYVKKTPRIYNAIGPNRFGFVVPYSCRKNLREIVG